MYYIVPTSKNVGDAASDLQAAVQKHGFGVLHVLDLKETLTRKGHPLDSECRIFEVCNPRYAARVLKLDMRLNMALPCRVSVFDDEGVTKIGTILPTEILRGLSKDPELEEVADSVETTIRAIVDEAAAPDDTRTALVRRRTALTREVQVGAAKRAAERGDNVPDAGELAADSVARDVAIAEVDRDVAEIEAIDAALERLDRGTYGRCVECGAVIGASRLARQPEAARCVVCQLHREDKSAARSVRL
jgi:RNA polymerase-binding protein DksA